MEETGFRKSSFCTDAHGCVEVRFGPASVDIRDAKTPDGALLTFDRAEWDAFVAGVMAGEFNR